MAYTFKSRATADMIVLESSAKRLLEMLGKTPGEPGIITLAQIPQAIATLEQAVRDDDALRQSLQEQGPDGLSKEALDAVEHGDIGPVSLRQRVAPFKDMLQRSAAEGKDVIWEL